MTKEQKELANTIQEILTLFLKELPVRQAYEQLHSAVVGVGYKGENHLEVAQKLREQYL